MKRVFFTLLFVFSLVFTSASLSNLHYDGYDWYRGDSDTYHSYERYDNDYSDRQWVRDYHDSWDERNYWARNYYATPEYDYYGRYSYRANTYHDGYEYDSFDNYKYDLQRRYVPWYTDTYDSRYDSRRSFQVYDDKILIVNGKRVDYRDYSDVYYDDYDYRVTRSSVLGTEYVQKCYVNPPKDVLIYTKC